MRVLFFALMLAGCLDVAGQVGIRFGGGGIDTSKQTKIQIQDEGINQGAAGQTTTLNVVGTQATIGVSGSTATLTINSGLNNGRIWYVSKANPNCSVNAKVGDPTKPFCNPWQGRDSMQNGDLMYVYKGDYTMGLVASGADKESASSAAFYLWNGARDSAYFYFENGVRFKTINGGGQLFLNTSLSANKFLRVSGEGTFDYLNNPLPIFTINSTSASAFLDFKIEGAQYLGAWWNATKINGNISIKFRRVVAIEKATTMGLGNIMLWNIGIDGSTVNARKSNYIFECDDIVFSGGLTSPANSGLLQYFTLDSANVHYKFKTCDLVSRGPVFKSRGFGTAVNNTNFFFDFDNAKIDDFYMKSVSKNYVVSSAIKSINYSAAVGYSDTLYLSPILYSASYSGTGNTYTVKAQNITSSKTLVASPPLTTDYMYVDISNYRQTRKAPIICTSTNERDGGNIFLNVRRGIFNSVAILEVGNSFSINMTGHYTITGDSFYKNFSSVNTYPRTFYNCTLINSGAFTFDSTNAININSQNVLTNNTAIDTDVTELITPIIRNTSVR